RDVPVDAAPAASGPRAATVAPPKKRGPAMPGPVRINLRGGLPDHDLGIALARHRRTRLALERGGEGRQVRRRADGAELRRGVLVGGDAGLQLLRGEVAAPHRG